MAVHMMFHLKLLLHPVLPSSEAVTVAWYSGYKMWKMEKPDNKFVTPHLDTAQNRTTKKLISE